MWRPEVFTAPGGDSLLLFTDWQKDLFLSLKANKLLSPKCQSVRWKCESHHSCCLRVSRWSCLGAAAAPACRGQRSGNTTCEPHSSCSNGQTTDALMFLIFQMNACNLIVCKSIIVWKNTIINVWWKQNLSFVLQILAPPAQPVLKTCLSF